MTEVITLLERKGRITYLPGCDKSKAFAESKLKKQITTRDIKTLEKLGFSIKIIPLSQ